MCIAGGGHGQTANLRILEGVAVVTAQRSRGIEDLYGINGQRFQCGETDSRAKQVVGMRRNRQPAAVVNDVAYFARRFSFQIWKLRTDAKKATIGGRHVYDGLKRENMG